MSSNTPRARHARDIQAPPSSAESTAQAWPAALRHSLVLLSAIILVVSAVGWWTLGRTTDSLSSGGDFGLGNEKDGATDILLVGSDSRKDAQGNPLTPEEVELLRAGDEEATNTDTIIVIRVPSDGSSATAISIPRDTYVHTNRLGNTKINGVYGNTKQEVEAELAESGASPEEIERRSTEAGRLALIQTISDLSGITVDHYAEIGLLGFVLLTDAIGGVDVCLNAPVYDEFSGADFPAGPQTLKGADALSFVRQRHGLPRGDLDRITRQQVFMASFTNKLLGAGTLSNPAKLSELGNAVQRSVVLDDNWDVTGFATQMQGLTGGNVKFETIPVTSIDGVGDYGESVVTIDKGQVHKYFETLLGTAEETTKDKPDSEKKDDHDAAKTTVSVYNATGIEGLATSVAGVLTEKGYTEGEIGNAEFAGVASSQVNAADPDDPAAKAISEALGGLPIVHDPSLDPHHISVTVAGDYAGPGLSADGTAEGAGAGEPGETEPPADDGANGDIIGQEGGAIEQDPQPPIDAGGLTCVN
ncbi:MAG: LCP family protein [Corynebacterium sp.]|uniref:LCP family protein n=1 Tax=Corynebacterium sp. TaxID=1720 RepID=UPI0026DC2474|nr:LCP family protein [Corynebacterium sp.]MDO5030189.1 LCP family protein [Corynebacterium sp.]